MGWNWEQKTFESTQKWMALRKGLYLNRKDLSSVRSDDEG